MIDEKQLAEFVVQLKSAARSNLQCVALYGSAVSQEFHDGFSDINLLCVVRELSPAALDVLAPAVRAWTAARQPAPLIFAAADLDRIAAVFPIEMLDIRDRHHILFGNDVLTGLNISMERQRTQLEHELRTKLLFLRQHYLMASGDDGRVRHLMLDSISNFIALFRHALIAMGLKPPRTKREIVEQLAVRAGFDAAPYVQLLQVRERTLKPEAVDAGTTLAKYFEGIEKAIKTVEALPASLAAAAP
jgi:hypothetical protein